MKGKIGYAAHVKRFYVSWYNSQDQRTYKIYQYKGFKLTSRDLAEKLRASMQGDLEKASFASRHTLRPGARSFLISGSG